MQCNNLLLMAVTKRNSNVLATLFFLYRLTNVSIYAHALDFLTINHGVYNVQ
jgi:hypothetical protein